MRLLLSEKSTQDYYTEGNDRKGVGWGRASPLGPSLHSTVNNNNGKSIDGWITTAGTEERREEKTRKGLQDDYTEARGQRPENWRGDGWRFRSCKVSLVPWNKLRQTRCWKGNDIRKTVNRKGKGRNCCIMFMHSELWMDAFRRPPRKQTGGRTMRWQTNDGRRIGEAYISKSNPFHCQANGESQVG